jgi:hypothetical protein
VKEAQTGKRQVVVVAREIMGRTLPFIVPRESAVHASYDMRRVNHSQEYVAEDGASVNQAESFFSRPRRADS